MGGRVVADLLIKIGADNSDAKAKLNQTDSLIGASVAKARAAGVAMTAALSVPVVAFGASAYQAASDVNESMNAVNVTFEGAADNVIAWSKTTADAMGISQAAALQQTAQFGVFAKAAGLSEQAAADWSQQIVSASADVASFYNANTPEVLDAMRAGLIGEFDPLQRFGVLMNAASVEQKAMTMTGKASAQQLTEQEKVAARYAIIMEQLGANGVIGDFARTQDSGANASRRLKANLTDLRASIGQLLVPVIDRAINTINRWIRALTALPEGTKRIIVVVAALAAALGPLLLLLTAIGPVLAALAVGFGILLSPITLLGAALLALGVIFRGDIVDALSEVGDRLGEFWDDLTKVYERLREGTLVYDEFADSWERIGGGASVASALIRAFGSALEDLLGVEMSDWFYNLAQAVDAFVVAAGNQDVAGMIRALFDIGVLTVDAVVNVLVTVGELLWGGFTEAVGDIWEWVKGKVLESRGPVGDQTGGPQPYGGTGSVDVGDVTVWVLGLLWGGIREGVGNLWEWVKEKLGFGGGATGMVPGRPETADPSGGDITIPEVIVQILKVTAQVAEGAYDAIPDQVKGGVQAALDSDPVRVTPQVEADTEKGSRNFIQQMAIFGAGLVTDTRDTLTSLPWDTVFDWVKIGAIIGASTVNFPLVLSVHVTRKFGPAAWAIVGAAFRGAFHWPVVLAQAAWDAAIEDLQGVFDVDIDLPENPLAAAAVVVGGWIAPVVDMITDMTSRVKVAWDALYDALSPDREATVDGDAFSTGVSQQLLGINEPVNVPWQLDPGGPTGGINVPETGVEPVVRDWTWAVEPISMMIGPTQAGAPDLGAPNAPMLGPVFKATLDDSDARNKAAALSTDLNTLASTPYNARFGGDTGAAAVAYTQVMGWGAIYAGSTFTGTFAGDTGPAAVAYTNAMSWGGIWEASTFTSTFAIDIGPAAVAYTSAFGWGYAWAGQVFTARFAVDVSGLYHAVNVAAWAAAQIDALMPHSPAKKGPLRRLPSFRYIGEIARRDLAGLGAILADAMDPGDMALPRFGSAGRGTAGVGVRDPDGLLLSGRGGVVQHNTYRIERANFGNGTDWDRFFAGKNREAAVAAWEQS